MIALWDKKALLGVSVIESITTGESVKLVYKCPSCGTGNFKRLRHGGYRCDCGAAFDQPAASEKPVTTYRSEHGAAWVALPGALDGPTLRGLCDSPKSQLSLRPMQWQKLRDALGEAGSGAPTGILENALAQIVGGHRTATVRIRIGQADFRRRLLATHGEECAITGPTPAAALEAAHLYSYAAHSRHHDEGGLLLRRDIHRLFDLGYIAVDPQRLIVDVVPEIRAFQLYADLHGSPLAITPGRGQQRWLKQHWAIHRANPA
jgi:ribosomal protein L37AE/L43A